MDKHFQSIALIRRMDDEGTRWLVKDNGSGLKIIRSERLENESFREVVLREVAWELDLDRARDFTVSKMPRLCMEYVGRLPDTLEDCHIAVAFFVVPIYRKSSLAKLETPPFHWVTSSELCSGKTKDDLAIDPQAIEWINRWEVVQPWT